MARSNSSNRWPTARKNAGIFFPQREALGFDSRECTPGIVRVATHLVSETRSFERAAVAMKLVFDHGLSAKTIERVAGDVGEELPKWQIAHGTPKESIDGKVAVISCDGGRIRTREPGHGPGVKNAGWRETKNALFERMIAAETHQTDPCPTLPDTFREVAHVAKIAEKSPFSAENPPERGVRYEGPKRLLRTCLSSMANSTEFGPMMLAEAERRNLLAAEIRVFLGDGQSWNWSIREKYFPTFTAILDFIHPIEYLYSAAQAWEADDAARWSRYLQMVEAVWEGRVAQVVDSLRAELAARGLAAAEKLADGHPLAALADAARYFHNNRERMDYPSYRAAGLPITSAPMESLIKQINQRVKGTEMTWNNPAGAEAILQIRAASLCEDGRLDDYLKRRPGCPYTRRSSQPAAA